MCNTTPIPNDRNETPHRHLFIEGRRGVALKEQFVGAKVKTIQGEQPSVTKVNYFKGSDPEKWKTGISTYDFVNLGEIYKGIALKLRAYRSNVEKLFYVRPGANPGQIKIKLSDIQPSGNPPPLSPSVRGTGGCPPLAGAGGGLGARGLWVNEHGELVAETVLGPVKFTKPIAYQEIDGKRVEVEVAYQIENCKLQNAEQGITHPLPLSKEECKSPLQGGDSGVGKFAIQNPKLNTDTDNGHASRTYGFTVASYDRTKDLIIDPLLASTYLGGGSEDIGYSLTLDTSGNVYVTGYTNSTDFPTPGWAYDTTFYGGSSDVFISRLDPALSTGTIVTTGPATNVTSNSATLNGTVNANGLSTTAWFEYGTISNSYSSISSKQTVNGTSDTTISIGISGLSAETSYYYKLVAQNRAGKTYGNENAFTTTILSPPTPTASPTPTPIACEASDILASPEKLEIKREESDDITVTVTCADGSPVAGEVVTAKIKSGRKRITVTPLSQATDDSGEAIFTITATKKTGNAKVKFETSGLKTIVTVKVN